MLFCRDNFQSVNPNAPQQQPRPLVPFATLSMSNNPQQQRPQPRRGINANYARELMELHTLGVDGGYTQQDVVEVARCFTGWQYHGSDEGNIMLTFAYFDYKHDQGAKTVLGHSIPANGGMNDGLLVLDI